jgi:hypothetical protein
MAFHSRWTSRHHRDDSIFDGRIANFLLVHQEHSPHGLEQNFRSLSLGRLQHPNQGIDLFRRQSVGSLLGARFLNRERDALLVEGLQQIIHRIDLERLHRILVKSSCEDDLGQGDLLVQQLLDDPEAVESGHLHIEKYEIGAVLLDQADRLEAVLALRHHVDVSGAFKQVGKFVAGELFIVHDYR